MTQPSLPTRTTGLRVFSASLLSALLIVMPFVQLAAAEKRSEVRSQRSEQTADGRRQDAASNTANAPENSFLNAPVPKPAPEPLVGPVIVATKDDGVLMTNTVNPGDTVTYTVNIQNNGTASPGDDATNVQFSDTIDAHTTLVGNSRVAAVSDKYNTIGNTQISVPDGLTDLLGNDFDPDNVGNDNAGMTVTGYGATTGTEQTSMGTPTATAQGGSVTVNANGSFTYDPPLGFEGTDTFKYRAADADGFTAITTVTITIAGMIWYVNNNAGACPGAPCDGRLSHPFQTLAAFQAVNNGTGSNPAAGDNIFLYESSPANDYVGPVTLLNNQRFIGQDATDSLATITGLTAPSGTGPFPIMDPVNGAIVNITSAANGITLGQNNVLRGFNVGNVPNANIKINGSGFGQLTIGKTSAPDVSTSGTGRALSLLNGTFAATSGINSLTSTGSSGAAAILLSQISSGTVTIVTTSVSGASAGGVEVNGSSANVNFGNTTINTGGTDGVILANNAAGTRTFGTLAITGGSGIGFRHFDPDGLGAAVGGGATTVAGATTITNSGTIGISVDSSLTLVSFTNANVTGSGGTGVSFTNNTNANGDLTFADLDISPNSNQAGLVANNNAGTVTSTTGDISTTDAIAINSTSSVLALAFNSVTAANSGSAASGISLTSTTGTLSSSAGTITGGTAPAVLVSGGSVQVTYGGGITQADNAALLSVSNANTSAINFNGNLSATNGTGLQFDNADGIYNFNATTTLTAATVGTDAGIDILSGSTGTFTFGTGTSITRGNSVSGAAFNLISSNANVTYSGSMTLGTSTGNMVAIDNHDAGTITFQTGTLTKGVAAGANATTGISIQNSNAGTINFNNPTITIIMSTGNAVSLTNNTGGVMNFTPAGGNGMDLSTTSGIGFNATGGGTINVTGSGNTITSTTGRALNVDSTTIGASGLTFLSISADGASSGIVLNNTGSSGGLTVTGNGGSCSTAINCTGGAIQNTTSHGISLTNTTSPSFDRMFIQNNVGSGVRGDEVTNFTFTNGFINNSGTGGGNQESSIAFNDPSGSATNRKVSGTVTITGNTLNNARWHGVSILQFNGLLADVNISNNTLVSGTTTGGGGNSLGSGIQLVPGGVAATSSNVTRAELNNNSITNFPGGVLIAVQCGTSANSPAPTATCGTPGSATNDIEIKNNILNGGGATVLPNQLVLITVNGRGQGQFTVQDNGTIADPMSGSAGNGIDISAGGDVTVQATVTGNQINVAGQTVNGTSGIAAGVGKFDVTGPVTLNNSTLYATINNNVVTNSLGSGIRLNVNEGSPDLHAIVKNNTVGTPLSATYGMQVQQGPTTPGTINKITNLEISGNISAGGSGGGNTFAGIGLRKMDTTVGQFAIVGLSPSPATNAQMETNVSGQNPASVGGNFDCDASPPFLGVVALNCSSSNWTSVASVPQPPAVAMLTPASGQKEHYFALNNNPIMPFGAETKDVSNQNRMVTQPAAFGLGAETMTVAMTQPATSSVDRVETRSLSHHANTAKSESRDQRSEVRSHHAKATDSDSRRQKAESRRNHAATSRAVTAPMADTVTANIGPLPAGGSATITFQVTVNNPPNLTLLNPPLGPRVENQGTVTADGPISVNTDDPETGTAGDATATRVDLFNTSTSVITSGSPSNQGDPVTFTATVTEVPGQTPNPSGTVQFLDGVTPLTCTEGGVNGIRTLSGGTAACTTSAITPAGSPHTINANYSGDGNFDASSGSVQQTVIACTTNPVVTNTNDSGADSLRQAILDACNGTTIDFAIEPGAGPHTILLTTGELALTKNVTITNTSGESVTVSGNNASRVFNVNAGKTVTIRGLTVSNGLATGATFPDTHGGGIFNAGTLNLISSTVKDSVAKVGAGGIYTGSGSTLNVVNSTISGNSIQDASTGGGGLTIDSATATVINSTISGNSTGTDGQGGGIHNSGSTLTISNSTIVSNTIAGAGSGGGINSEGVATVNLGNTIVANNSAATDPDLKGTYNSQGHNLIEAPGSATIGGTTTGNITGQDPVLGPLVNNGGPTMTHALLAGSPAIEAGNNCVLTASGCGAGDPAVGLTTDQRGVGYPRNADSADPNTTQTVDIGAFELHPTIENIGDQTTAEDTAFNFNFNIGDDTGALITSVTATSDNQTLVPDANLIETDPAPANDGVWNLSITPALNANSPADGTATITVTVTATNGQTAVDTFVVTVTEVNDAPVPTNDTVGDVAEDSGTYVIPFATLLGNDTNKGAANESGQTLNITAVSSPTGGTVAINGTNVEFTPTADFFGPAGFTYTVTDNGTTGAPPVADPKNGNATVSFNITAVNDDPTVATNTGMTVNEGSTNNTITSSMLSVTDVDNTAAQLTYTVGTAPANGTLRKSGGALASGGTFTQADIDGNLITYDHDGSETTADSFTFTVSDGTASIGPFTFNITITAVNNAPAVTAGGTLNYTENDAATAIDTTITVNDVDSPNLVSATAQITGNYVNGEDVLSFTDTATITGVFNAGSGTLTLTGSDTVANYQTALRAVKYHNTSENPSISARTVSWIVNDGSLPSSAVTSTINVTSVNDPPVNTVPSAQGTNLNTPLTFSSGSGNQISVTDVDAGSADIRITLTATNGTITLGSIPAGLSFGAGDGTADTTMTFDGTLTEVNTAMNGMSFNPTAGFSGAATLTVTSNDLGNTGTGGALDDTDVVNIQVATNINIQDAQIAEPSSGTTNMVFTVSLSAPAPAGGASVQYATANGGGTPATGGGTCVGAVDYVTVAPTTLSFAAGEQFKTISVTVCSDGTAEPDETFLVNLSNAVNATIADGQAVGTITAANPAGTLLISEFRQFGPGPGNDPLDDFVEIYNNTNADITVPAGGYGLFKMGATCTDTPQLIGIIPATTVIKARSHFLFTGPLVNYSLEDYGGTNAAAGDALLTVDLGANENFGLFATTDVSQISSVNRFDAVGFGSNNQGACDLLREGSTLPALTVSPTLGQHSYFRKMCEWIQHSGCTVPGVPKDTNDNSVDFWLADTAGSAITGRLGAPGPENLASPIRRDNANNPGSGGIDVFLLDSTVGSAAGANRDRNGGDGAAGTFGSMTLRYRVTNNTGAPVTRLRYRIVDISTAIQPAGPTADLRAITGTDHAAGPVHDIVTCTAGGQPAPPPGCTVTVRATTLETPWSPPAPSIGGGYNSTLSSGTITTGSPLPTGQSILINFKLGVQKTGTFRFYIVVEALP